MPSNEYGEVVCDNWGGNKGKKVRKLLDFENLKFEFFIGGKGKIFKKIKFNGESAGLSQHSKYTRNF